MQLLKVQSEYAEMTFNPDCRNAPPSALLAPNQSATHSQLNTHQHTECTQPQDDWTALVMPQGSLHVESVVMETEIDKMISEAAKTQTLTGSRVIEATSQSLAPLPVTPDPPSPDLRPPTGSSHDTEQTPQQRPRPNPSQTGGRAVAEPRLAVSTAALVSLISR